MAANVPALYLDMGPAQAEKPHQHRTEETYSGSPASDRERRIQI
jgi:hypothetical protein